MAYLHWRRRTRIQIPNPIATLHYTEHIHMAQTQTWIPTPHFCIGQESESKSIPLSEFNNVSKPKFYTKILSVRDVKKFL